MIFLIDDKEVSILRAAQVLDQHVKLIKPKEREVQSLGFVAARNDNGSQSDEEADDSIELLGYKMQAAAENPQYTTDYFFS